MNQEELNIKLLNTMEALNNSISKLNDTVKRAVDASNAEASASKDLNLTIQGTNKVFEQVSQGVKDIYAKIQALELFGKMMGGLGPLFGGAGGTKKP